jgi:hypothetical protein
MKKTVLLILFLFVLNLHADISMQPYLMGVTSNSVYILVECSSIDPVTVNFGFTTSYGMTATDELYSATTNLTYVHKIKLTNLLPDTIYHFKAVQLTSSSTDSYFRTAPLPGKSFRFAWEADMRTNTAPHDQIAALINAANPVLLLQGGDVCYSSIYSYFKSEFFRPNELNLLSHVPFAWSPGNHETWGINAKAFSKAPSSSSGIEDYYSFDYGDIHFLILNTELPYAVGSAQYNWVMKDLDSTRSKWKIVISHIPGYTAGGTGTHGEDTDMIAMSVNLFTPKGVDLVLNGHNHFYQHSRVSGIDYFVIGSAGAPLKPTGSAYYTIKSVSDYCYGIFDFTPNSIKMSVYNNVNTLLDSLTITKKATPTISITALISGLFNGTTMVPDSVTIELHSASFPYPLISSSKNLLDSNGKGVFYFSNGVSGTPYYLALKHRNAIETWSAFPVNVSTYDFTSANSQSFGNNQVLKGSKWCIYSGDINQDGLVSLPDLIAVDNDNGNYTTGYTSTDVTGDNQVTLGDLIIVDNYNADYVCKILPSGAPTHKNNRENPIINN